MAAFTSLVTGGAGFIGHHLVNLLAERGERVRVLDLDEGARFPESVEFRKGSVTDARAVRAALEGVERVYHLAGNPNLWTARKGEFDEVNYGGTCTVLSEAGRALERGAPLQRIVFTSTESILCGERPYEKASSTDESVKRDIGEMVGPYCRSKFRAEQEARAAAARGLPLVIVNPTLPVGPGDRRITPPTRMILGFLNGAYPAYLDCALNMIDVRDIALGHLLAAEKGKVGERYILGHRNLRLSELLALLEAITGAAMPRLKVPYPLAYAMALVSEFIADHVTHRPPKAPITGVRLAGQPMRFDSSKANRELGLEPRPLEQSLAEAVAWMLARGLITRPLPKLAPAGAGLARELA